MLVEQELAQQSADKDTMLTIGVFDGVHLGHKYLLSQLKEQARKQNLATGVITFRLHPQELIDPDSKLPYLTSLAQRMVLLKKEGIDHVIVLSFTQEVSDLSAREFVGILKKYLRMKGLVLGPDFALGKNREGNIETLRKLGEEMGFTVVVVPPIKTNNEVISSTAIRHALAEGNVKKVRFLAGQNFSFTGPVVSGEGRGRKLGFPTANLDVDSSQAVPQNGIYVTLAYVKDKIYPSLTSIGVRPTFEDGRRTIEVYLLDFQGDLYGKELRVEFIERLREEKKFDSIEDLKKAIAEDVKQGRAILDSLKSNPGSGS